MAAGELKLAAQSAFAGVSTGMNMTHAILLSTWLYLCLLDGDGSRLQDRCTVLQLEEERFSTFFDAISEEGKINIETRTSSFDMKDAVLDGGSVGCVHIMHRWSL